MYLICTYDVDAKNDAKIMKVLRKYLFHMQNSVFEGEITPSKFRDLKEELNRIIDETESIFFYFTYENKALKKEYIGKTPRDMNILI